MVDVAYFVATKRIFRVAANIAVRSLRQLGGFEGDIVVFSDRPFPLPSGVQLRLLLPEQQQRLTFKTEAARLLDLERYRCVIYSDCDILFRSSIAAVVNRCHASGRLICADDMGSKAREDYFCRCFTAEELARLGGEPGANSGFFCAPGARLREFVGHWESEIRSCVDRPGLGFDQPPFNAAIRRGLIPADVLEGLMWFPLYHPNAAKTAGRWPDAYVRAKRDAPLIHFNSLTGDRKQLLRMAAWYALGRVGQPFVRTSEPIAKP